MDTTSVVERTTRLTAAAVLLGFSLAVAACSSGGAASQPAGAGTPGTAATQGASATPAPTEAAVATSQSGGGGGSGGECDLVTTAEMASALGTGALTAEPDPGPPPGCGYRLNGTPVAAVIVTASGGEASFDAMVGAAGSVAVSGVGDKALFNEDAHEFLFLKGGKLVAVVVTLGADALPASPADVYKQIATIAAGRL